MRQTVPFPVSPKPVTEDQELIFINQELLKVLPQLRTFANMLSWEIKTVTTAGGGVYTTAWTSPVMPKNSTWTVLVYSSATEPVPGTNGDHAGFLIAASFTEGGGFGPTQLGATTFLFSARTAGFINAQFTVDPIAQTVLYQVRDRGSGVSLLTFTSVIVICEALQA